MGDETHLPHLDFQFVTRLYWRSEPSLEIAKITSLVGSIPVQDDSSGHVPAIQAVHDDAAVAEGYASFRRSMERIVVTIQAVHVRNWLVETVLGTI